MEEVLRACGRVGGVREEDEARKVDSDKIVELLIVHA